MAPRIVIADDHPLVLLALRRLVEPFAQVIGTAGDGGELLEKAVTLRPDAIILDVGMPVIDGLEAARRIRPVLPELPIAFWTMTEEPPARELDELRPVIWLGKNMPSAELVVAFARWLTPSEPSDPNMPSRPTPRQLQVLRLLAEGQAMKQVARRLGLSARTVAFHKYRAMKLLGLESTADLVRYVMHSDGAGQSAAAQALPDAT